MYDELLDVVPDEPRGNGSNLPDSSLILAMGIISLVTSILCCIIYGLPGLITGIVGLVMGNKSLAIYKRDPSFYSNKSFKDVKAGRICSIIGISLSGLILLILGIALIIGMTLIPENFNF